MDLDPGSEVVVYCDCGAKYVLTGSHMDDAIECGNCGRRVRRKADAIECGNCGRRVRRKAGNTTRMGAPARTALQAYAEKHGDEEKIAQACHYAKAHKYIEALTLYEGVLAAHLPLRDVFYGMGYCHYRLGEPNKALVFLELARDCGHTTALELIRKVGGSMDNLPPLKTV